MSIGVSGSYPDPAEAKLTPVSRSFSLTNSSKYGGIVSLRPTYEAACKHYSKCERVDNQCIQKLKRLESRRNMYLQITTIFHCTLPKRSVGSLPFVNLPVGLCCKKSLP